MDFMHSHQRDSTTIYADALYTTLNEGTEFIKDQIQIMVIRTFPDVPGRYLEPHQKVNLISCVLELFQNTYCGSFDPNELLDPETTVKMRRTEARSHTLPTPG